VFVAVASRLNKLSAGHRQHKISSEKIQKRLDHEIPLSDTLFLSYSPENVHILYLSCEEGVEMSWGFAGAVFENVMMPHF